MAPRTDIHRAGAIIPAHYTVLLHYAFGSANDPSIAVDCTCPTLMGPGFPHRGEACCLARLRDRGVKWAEHGHAGKCTACGASFRYGSVFVHDNGEHIHLGHECADKYDMMMDLSSFELELGRQKKARAIVIERERKASERAAFLALHPGLAEDLECNHRIVVDIKARFTQWCTLSDKQIALVRKLAAESRLPKEPEPVRVPAPTGRVEFCGKILAFKSYSVGPYPDQISLKMLLEVPTEGGSYLVWCTQPQDAYGADRGDWIHISATLEQGRNPDEPHFAVGKRPMVVRVGVNPRKARKVKPVAEAAESP